MMPGPLATLSATNRASRTTALSLVVANLLPLIGILFLGWSPSAVVLAYVLETVIVGVYTCLRILLAQRTPVSQRIGAVMFFAAHYGFFVLIQTVFLLINLGLSDIRSPAVQRELIIAGLGFLVSHGISFATHYVRGGEYRSADARIEIFRPYGRIFVQQFVAIVGFWLAIVVVGQGVAPVVLLVVCKLVLDLHAHLRAHAVPRATQPLLD